MDDRFSIRKQVIIFGILTLTAFSSCAKSGKNSSTFTCAPLTGTPYVPSVSAVSSSNHDASVIVAKSIYNQSGALLGLADPVPLAKELVVSFPMTNDLGAGGSISLVANVTNISGIDGNGFAVLTSLSDGTNEYVNFSRSGAANDCTLNGYYDIQGNQNPSCVMSAPSAYGSFSQWQQHQILALNLGTGQTYPSVNTFPTCNWVGGNPQPSINPNCAFNTTFFSLGKLKYGAGVNYTARYALLSDKYFLQSDKPPRFGAQPVTANLQLNVIKKTDTNASSGSVDVNLVVVGNTNINASRSAKGKQNLDTLLTALYGYYNQTNTQIKIGKISVIEWPCSNQGDAYASLTTSQFGQMLTAGSALLDPTTEGKALNVFLVSQFTDPVSNGYIEGLSAAIGGPPLNGTPASGLAFATQNYLDKYNPNCPSNVATCSLAQQESQFWGLAAAMAHEMGHFFGLNHPSESSGTQHDVVLDTPVCTNTDPALNNVVTNYSCSLDANLYQGSGSSCASVCAGYPQARSSSGTLCPAAVECQFNHIMFWTSKHFISGVGDGNLFSPQSSSIINYNSYIQ